MRILVVEDEPAIATDISSVLSSTGYIVDVATDGEEGWFRASTDAYDAVILDLGLPKLDGLSVLKRLREVFSMYDMRPDRVGWTVYDVETGKPAVLDELVLTALEHDTADELVSLLNRNVYGTRQKRLSKWPLPPSAARRDAGRQLTPRYA
jgi:PleD family two-component response regulator